MAADSPRQPFATTRWSLVVRAADPDSADAHSALSSLCEIYWTPVYAFIRRTGRSPEDAQDLTQAFFTRVLEKDSFRAARQERGRFRSFLLESVRHFLANEWDRSQTLKRGGEYRHFPLEFDAGERRYLMEPADELTPERLYDRRWASAALDAAKQRIADLYNGREETLRLLRPFLEGDETASYRRLAKELGVTEGSLRVAVHRLRHQFAKCLRETIAETVDRDEDVEEELRYLLAVVGRA